MSFLIVIGVLVGVGIVLWGALTVREVDQTTTARLQRFNVRPASRLTELELQIPRGERLLGPTRRRLAGLVRQFTPMGSIAKTQTRLMQAGNPRNITVQDFLALRAMMAIGLGVLAFILDVVVFRPGFLVFTGSTVAGFVIGYVLPGIWLGRVTKKRQAAVLKYLPDAIDILAISVEAGQGFDGALASLSSRKTNELTYEFDRFRVEIQAGKGRREAFKDLALRVGVEDLTNFIAAMVQADQLGIGIAQVLRVQSEELRIKRRQRAEEKAQKAPTKMLFPLIFLMFPALFIVILGPAVPSLLNFRAIH
jgi:tight adherence protein C